jgi:glucoamylase
MVMTALGTSRVWVTLGYGILNEVYWPATGLPQIRDLGFIVAGPSRLVGGETRQLLPGVHAG